MSKETVSYSDWINEDRVNEATSRDFLKFLDISTIGGLKADMEDAEGTTFAGWIQQAMKENGLKFDESTVRYSFSPGGKGLLLVSENGMIVFNFKDKEHKQSDGIKDTTWDNIFSPLSVNPLHPLKK